MLETLHSVQELIQRCFLKPEKDAIKQVSLKMLVGTIFVILDRFGDFLDLKVFLSNRLN